MIPDILRFTQILHLISIIKTKQLHIRLAVCGDIVTHQLPLPFADGSGHMGIPRKIPEERLPLGSISQQGLITLPVNQRKNIAPIQLQAFIRSNAGHFHEGRIEIDQIDRRFTDRTLLHTGAEHQKRNANAALPRPLLATLQGRIVGEPMHPAVVGINNHVGIIDQLMPRVARIVRLLEIANHLPNVVIHRIDHAGVVRIAVTRQVVIRLGRIGRILQPKLVHIMIKPHLIAGLNRPVHLVRTVVHKERLVLMLFHEAKHHIQRLIKRAPRFV